MPQLIVGLRITLGIAWLVVVAAEMIAVNSGLGFLIVDARNAGNRYDLVIAGMALIGVIGLLLDTAMRKLETLKSPGPDGYYSEQAEAILANPLRNISIKGKTHPIIISPYSITDESIKDQGTNEREKGLLAKFYENPHAHEFRLEDIEHEFWGPVIRTDTEYVVLNFILEGFNLLRETGSRHAIGGVNPFPHFLVSKSSKDKIVVKYRPFGFSSGYIGTSVDGKIRPDKQAIDFLRNFMDNYLEWLVQRGARDIDRYWDINELGDGKKLELVPRIYDKLRKYVAK